MFKYNKEYFKKHYSSSFYNMYIKLRNRSIYRKLKKYIESGNFLDIGFGDDNLVRYFDKDFKVFGVDISEYAVHEIRKKYPEDQFKINNIDKQDIPFTEKFDWAKD